MEKIINIGKFIFASANKRLSYNPRSRRYYTTDSYKAAKTELNHCCKKVRPYVQADIRIVVKLSGYIDIDNGLKCILDAIEGRAYENDRGITELHVYMEKEKKNQIGSVETWIEHIEKTNWEKFRQFIGIEK